MGPLAGVRIIEFVGLGPAPFAAMMLADMGAEMIRIERKPASNAASPYPILGTRFDVMARNRRSLALDLKDSRAVEVALRLLQSADALIEGFRPGVMERLGLGPDVALARNPRLVFTRVTGWGQTGPLRHAAGHDLNYIALSGMLAAMGRPDSPPAPPLNLIGDFGGGGMLAAFGTVCALLEARSSGKGQVIDAAMLDGANLLGAMVYGFHALGKWSLTRGENWIDGAAPYYDTYACADGKFIAIAPIEPHFYDQLLALTKADDPALRDAGDPAKWPDVKARMAALFIRKSRAEWCELLEGTDACFSPVLDVAEAPQHPQNLARDNFAPLADVPQPTPAPRFSRTEPALRLPPPHPGEHSRQILTDWGFTDDEIAALVAEGVIGDPSPEGANSRPA